VEENVATVRNILFIGVPILIGVVAVMTWLLVGRALRPVEAIRSEMADISSRDLARRVPEPDAHDEIGRLARTINATLDRLADSVERQRRFVADASHELQSPVAATQTVLEVALSHPDEADWEDVATDVLEEHQRIERLVRDLLYLAQSDGGVTSSVVSPVDLDDVVLREVARLQSRARVRFDIQGVRPVEARGDADQLARAMRNLLENANRYAASVVTVTLSRADDTAEIDVIDDGPGIAATDREHIFERFVRTDAARGRETGGTGLGLAIARDIAVAHGGSLTLAESGGTDGRGSRFLLCLPLPHSPSAS
jgi:signal transduction histidine kinase